MSSNESPSPETLEPDVFPAAKAQEQLYFVQQVIGDSPAYHVPVVFALTGRLDPAALECAVRRVALRHEALRTHFTLGDDGLRQVVTDRPADWRIVDCASEDELASLLRSETDRPFDLEAPPLFRAALLRRDERTALLVLTMHHIVCDGWSLGIVVDELFRHYGAFAAGRDLDLPEPEFQYGDYADWQRAWLRSPAAEKHLDFWSRTLGGELPVLELPGDRPAGAPAPGLGGGLLTFPLEPELLDGLHALATTARSTLFTVLLAAYQVLLSRYTGVEDVIVGSPVANRSRIEFERTVGFFVNMVAIRTDLGPAVPGTAGAGTGGPSFRELLTRVRTAALQAQDHHELPFESVVQLVNPRRDPGHDPVFQALFMLDDTTTEPPAAEGLEIVPVPVHSDTAKFQLSLQVNEHDDRPGFELEYRTDRFTPEWAQRFAGHYARLLRLVVEEPDRPLDELFDLPAAERAPARADGPGRAPEDAAGHASADGRGDSWDDGWDDEDDTPYVAPRDEDERILAEVWQQALGRSDIGIDHNYFEVGGDSILSIQILSRARRHGLRFELRDLLVAQTIRELTPLVTRTAPEAEAALEPFDLLTAADRAQLPDGLADAYPLTSLQAGMLYHSELDAVHRAYHDVAGYHLRGPYSPPAWRSAVAALLERHELLRTSFALRDLSEPVQLVHHQVTEPPVTFEDLGAVPADEQPEALRRHYAWEREHPFDWERPPLIRFHVQRRSADTFQLWVVEHHAILDGWSGRQLLTELLELYLQALGRSTRELPPPPLARFRSLVALEREAVADPAQRAFWREQLDGMTALRLPRTAPAGGVPDLVMTEYELPEQLSADLLRTAAELGVPVRIALLAAHLRVLALLGGTDDVVSGAVYNGRIAEEDGERVVGLFLNTLPVRARITDRTTWASLVADVAATDLALQPHRRLPLATVQQDAGGGPLFETFFNYTHFHAPDEGTAGELEILDEFGVVPTNFPFGVEFMRDARTGRIGLGLRYDAAQFATEEIDRWAGYHLAALRSLAGEPGAGIGRTELPAPAELALLDHWNDTATTYHRPHLLHVLVEEQARLTPDRIAVVFEGDTLSYRELDRRAGALAHRLVDRGVKPGDRVGVCLERSTELVVALLAVLKAGAAYVPIDPEHPVARIGTMVAEAAPALVLTTTALAERVEPSGAAVEAVDARTVGTGTPAGGPRVAVDPDAPAYLIFTSGSTGVPKGVVVSHRAICNRLLWMQEEFGLTEADRVLQKTPYTFDVSVWEFFWPLIQGARLVVAAPGAHREPEELAQLIREQAVTTVHFVPSMLRVFLDHADPADCASLRLVVCSGEALPADLRDAHHERLDAELVNLYGPTEAAVDVTCWRCRPGDGPTVPIGHPIANIRIHLLDARLNRVPVGVTGELYIGGVGLADGYHGRPDLTAERFVEHTWPDGGTERLYRTGDLARRRPDGAIEYLGRADQQVKVRGMRIELGEIEAALTRHPDVREAAVVLHGHRLAAYVAAPEAVTGDALAEYLGDTLPEYMLPSVWTRLERLPLASNGKVDRKLLPEPGPAALAGERTPAPPVTDVQRRLVRVWEETLGVSPIGIHDSFFALGGHSLVALNLAMRIRREFGRKLPVAELLTHNTVARLAPLVTARESGDEDPARLLPIRRAGEGAPLTLVHPVGGGVFCYLPLASQLRPGRPVYGIVSEGLVSGSVAHLSVERIAESYVDLLVAKQPKGPYHLAGWSFGAVLVFEMACLLRRRGAEVGSLSMIDAAYPGQFDESLRDEDLALLVFVDVLRAAGMAVPEHDDAEWAAALAEFPTIHRKLRWLVSRLPTAADGKATELEQWEAYFKVFTTNLTAHNDYRPGRYPGDVVYIEGLDGGAIGSAGAWRAAVDGRFSAHTIEASHYDILQQPHVRQMALLVDRALDGAVDQPLDGAPDPAPDGTPR